MKEIMSEKTADRVVAVMRNTTFRQILIWTGLILGIAFIVNTTLILEQANLIPTSSGNEGNGGHIEHSEFGLKVAATGKTIYTDVPKGALKGTAEISAALASELLDTTYPDPETATEAAIGHDEDLSGNPAFAHAVNICTHSDGKVSNQTGGGRHLTWFRFHDNGRHYTRTAHQVLTQNGYLTTDTFDYSVSRRYCGCG